MAQIITHTLHNRALKVTVGTQITAQNSGKTIIRLECWSVAGARPKMRVEVEKNGDVPPGVPTGIDAFEDAECVQLVFDNKSFSSHHGKPMPACLVEALEFAAKKLREQYSFSHTDYMKIEEVD